VIVKLGDGEVGIADPPSHPSRRKRAPFNLQEFDDCDLRGMDDAGNDGLPTEVIAPRCRHCSAPCPRWGLSGVVLEEVVITQLLSTHAPSSAYGREGSFSGGVGNRDHLHVPLDRGRATEVSSIPRGDSSIVFKS